MHFSHISLLALPLLAASTPTGTNPNSFFYKSLTLTFSGGPASYTLTFPADGNTYSTNNNLNINRITSTDFNIFYNCNFYFADDSGKTVVTKPGADNKEIQVGTPRAVTGVSCQPTPGGSNTCLPTYADCQWCGGANGQGGCYSLNCCSGYCFGNKCRDL